MLLTWLSGNVADLIVQVLATGSYSNGCVKSLPTPSMLRPPHRVELVVEIGIEIDANHPDTGARHVWTCRPAPVTHCRLRGLGLVGSWFLRWALSPLAQC